MIIKKNSCANFILSYCVSVLIHNESLISLYEITTSPVCWYLFELSCSTVFLSIMCIMISGILITAKCHMHVFSVMGPLHRIEKQTCKNFCQGVTKYGEEKHKKGKSEKSFFTKSDVLLLN